ncbi:hypothetical protein SINU_04825, partial [Sporolactobacillus inulinus CASD]
RASETPQILALSEEARGAPAASEQLECRSCTTRKSQHPAEVKRGRDSAYQREKRENGRFCFA